MNIQKIIKIVALLIGLVAVFFLVRVIMIGDDAIEADVANQGIVSGFITLAMIVLAIATIAAVVFSLVNLVSNPDKLKRALIAVGAFALVIVIAWFLSTGVERTLEDGTLLTSGQSQLIEAGIKTFYILILLAGGLMLFYGVKKMLSK